MTEFSLLLNALRLAIVLLGATFLVVAWRASHRHRSRSLLVLSGAIVLLILSAVWEPLMGNGIAGNIAETGIMAVAMMLFVFSLIVPDAPRVEGGVSGEE